MTDTERFFKLAAIGEAVVEQVRESGLLHKKPGRKPGKKKAAEPNGEAKPKTPKKAPKKAPPVAETTAAPPVTE